MSWCNPSPFPKAVLAEASRIAPGRRTSSDGICGDIAHQHEVSDHNPVRGIPHAVDISQSTPGSPFWQPHFQVFDAHLYGLLIAGRIKAGTEKRVKYLVSNYGHGDVIFDPSVSMTWRSNATGSSHESHLHVSFNYNFLTEQSTAPFFAPHTTEPDMPLNTADLNAIRDIVKQELDKGTGGSSMSPPGDTIVDVVKHYTSGIAADVKALLSR